MAKTETRPIAKRADKSPAPAPAGWSSYANLRREIDRLFEDFYPTGWLASVPRRDLMPDLHWPWNGSAMIAPAMDLIETDNSYEITAELPGLKSSDIEVRMANGNLLIKGEKREHTESEEANYHLSERRYGAFQRSIRLPDGIDTDKIDSKFTNGVLKVTIPKTAEARKEEKKIEVKAG